MPERPRRTDQVFEHGPVENDEPQAQDFEPELLDRAERKDASRKSLVGSSVPNEGFVHCHLVAWSAPEPTFFRASSRQAH